MTKKESHGHEKHDKKEEMQAKYVQYQVLKQQMQAFAEEKQIIDERLNELNVTIDVLHKLDSIAKGEEIWSPIGSGSFLRSDIKDTQKVLIAIGAGIVAKETKERAIEILQSRLENLTKLNTEVIAEMTKYSHVIEKLEHDLEKLASHE